MDKNFYYEPKSCADVSTLMYKGTIVLNLSKDIHKNISFTVLELVNPEIRARMNGLATTSWTIGLCLLPLVAYLTRDWVRLSIVTTSFAAGLTLYWK